MNEERDRKFMDRAIELSKHGMREGRGGPFGCVIVRGDEVVAEGNNQVISLNDPTAHAEIVAIREACRKLGTFQLSDCEIYTSCEPCPMCLGAIYWARPKRVVFANTREDAAAIEFDDAFIYDEIVSALTDRRIPFEHQPHPGAQAVFEEWKKWEGKTRY
ncbi:MAG TPA: nucleoside deaminase [Chitinophagaceae bacterium]|nr:nucleoside deaminase [Chitinophagaceae bacterium]